MKRILGKKRVLNRLFWYMRARREEKWTTKALWWFLHEYFPLPVEPAHKGHLVLGFSAIYHGSDPVSTDTTTQNVPVASLSVPMNIQQLVSHLSIVSSFALLSWRRRAIVEGEVALMYGLIAAWMTRLERHSKATSLGAIRTWSKFIKVKTALIYFLGND